MKVIIYLLVGFIMLVMATVIVVVGLFLLSLCWRLLRYSFKSLRH